MLQLWGTGFVSLCHFCLVTHIMTESAGTGVHCFKLISQKWTSNITNGFQIPNDLRMITPYNCLTIVTIAYKYVILV